MNEPDPEAAAETILQQIDRHKLSSPDVPRDTSREFWLAIIAGLESRLAALGGGE